MSDWMIASRERQTSYFGFIFLVCDKNIYFVEQGSSMLTYGDAALLVVRLNIMELRFDSIS
jgi:hypothetical protein